MKGILVCYNFVCDVLINCVMKVYIGNKGDVIWEIYWNLKFILYLVYDFIVYLFRVFYLLFVGILLQV